jgi:hypothetical protein
MAILGLLGQEIDQLTFLVLSMVAFIPSLTESIITNAATFVFSFVPALVNVLAWKKELGMYMNMYMCMCMYTYIYIHAYMIKLFRVFVCACASQRACMEEGAWYVYVHVVFV